MTLASETTTVSYSGDGSTTAFSITFIFWDDADIEAIKRSSAGVETTLSEGTHYTLAGGDGSTGTLTTTGGNTIASGETLVIRSNRAATQPTSLPLGGSFPSTSVEQALDQTIRIVQQRAEELDRTPKFAKTSTTTNITVPDPVASQFLRWNAAADDLENADVADQGDIGVPVVVSDGGTGATTAAGARTNLGLGTAATKNTGASGDAVPLLNQATTFSGTLTLNSKPLELAEGAAVASASSTDIWAGDDGNTVHITGTATITDFGTAPQAGAIRFCVADAAFTITHNATSLILPGSANITSAAGDTFIVYADTTANMRVLAYQRASGSPIAGVTRESDVDATNGGADDLTQIDFTSLPSGLDLIVISFDDISLSGTDNILVQIGDSGGIETTGYVSACRFGGADVNSTSGYIIRMAAATSEAHGPMILYRMSGNKWGANLSGAGGSAGADDLAGGGMKELSAELDRVRITVTGSDTFDSGNLGLLHRVG